MLDKRGHKQRFHAEKSFHDKWAKSEKEKKIDVIHVNEVCTSPEMRKITELLGNLNGRSILDVGCGLGESSVYFAIKGAKVTSTDISPEMLNATERLAKCYNTTIYTHLSASEDLLFPPETLFDIIYLGNLLHHVDIDVTIQRLKKHLGDNGIFVCWEPIAYNPLINVYRKIATEVRTQDEHPLTKKDIQLFSRHFKKVDTYWFWFTTLIVFIIMMFVQFQNPNKVRYWKKIVEDGNKWKWIYEPLEKVDHILLKIFPFLKWFCWNVVIISTGKKEL